MSEYPQVGGSYVINDRGEFVRREEDQSKPVATQEKPSTKPKNITDATEEADK